MTDLDLAARLKLAREQRYESAQDACAAFGWKYPTYAGHENGNRGFRVDTARTYANAFRVSLAWLLTGRGQMTRSGDESAPALDTPLKGYVGAGGQIEAVDAGDLGLVETPPGAAPGTVAAEVRGLSMMPAYEDGTLIYWSATMPPETMVNRRCVAQLTDGRIMVKILRRSEADGYWNLESINPAYPLIEDVLVEWVAKIEWTRPRP